MNEITARVRTAIEAAKTHLPKYWESCLIQRQGITDGSMGSYYPGASAAGVERAIMSAEWTPYEHPEIMSGCVAAIAPIPGRLGLVRLADLPTDTAVYLFDPKETSKVSAVVAGVSGRMESFTIIILGPEKIEDEEVEVVYTFHPGAPVRASELPASEHLGQVTVAKAVELGFDLAKIDREFPKHMHGSCLACDKTNFPCHLEVCYEIGIVGRGRECNGCYEYYKHADEE